MAIGELAAIACRIVTEFRQVAIVDGAERGVDVFHGRRPGRAAEDEYHGDDAHRGDEDQQHYACGDFHEASLKH